MTSPVFLAVEEDVLNARHDGRDGVGLADHRLDSMAPKASVVERPIMFLILDEKHMLRQARALAARHIVTIPAWGFQPTEQLRSPIWGCFFIDQPSSMPQLLSRYARISPGEGR